MLNMILAGGWVMCPLLICSVFALAIIIERSWCLRFNKIIPEGLSVNMLKDIKNKALTKADLSEIEQSSPLGALLTLVIKNIKHDRPIILENIKTAGIVMIHSLERNLNFLGTLATIAPLLGLFGTVIGIIDVFSALNINGINGSSDPSNLAGGISVALITTATGLCIAIPSLIFYRTFERKLDAIAYKLESEALKFLDALVIINNE